MEVVDAHDLSSFTVKVKCNLLAQLKQHNLCKDSIVLSKRTKDFKQGDFCVPRACLTGEVSSEVFEAVQKELVQQSEVWPVKIRAVTSDTFNAFIIHVNRVDLYGEVTKRFENNLDSKEAPATEHRRVIVNVPLLLNSGSEDVTVDHLRAIVLAQHVSCLLRSQGHSVEYSPASGLSETLRNVLDSVGFEASLLLKSDDNYHDVISKLRTQNCCSTCDDKFTEKSERSGLAGKADNDYSKSAFSFHGTENVVFDLKKYLDQEHLPVGKGNFDKNLTAVHVVQKGTGCDVLTQVSKLSSLLQESDNRSSCLHVVSQSQSFNQQKVHLLLRAVADRSDDFQSHLVYGPVTLSKSSNSTDHLTARQYIELWQREMTEAAVMKYGEAVTGKGWERTLKAVTAACVKFELLSTVARNTVKLTVSSDGSATGQVIDTGGGSFVMYNCARLATLFSKFQDEVQKGVYPQLPALEEINFSTLREEVEWELMFTYVAPFPDFVRQIVADMSPSGTIVANLHTHKICGMLVSLSRCLSSYYSRYHVLGEPRAHLLPTMFARLYLLRAVHQVLVSGLALMEIPALSQL